MKKRTGDPWIAAADYGALLPQFTVNLIVRDIDRALEFYRKVLRAQVHYSDPDFAALRVPTSRPSWLQKLQRLRGFGADPKPNITSYP